MGLTCRVPSLKVTCEVRFPLDENHGIKAKWLLNGESVDEGAERSTQDLAGAATYYFTRECDVSNFGNLTCLAMLGEGDKVNFGSRSFTQSRSQTVRNCFHERKKAIESSSPFPFI